MQDYAQAVSWAAQTALRDIIGRTTLTDLLRGRERIEDELQQLIDRRSNPWGVTVSSVEMRDVVIPGALQDAMSREAQAAREKQARIILGEAEMEIAHSFEEAAKSYHNNPTALHLRAMNMLYEGLKEKGALMLVPSSAVESMGMGGLMGAAALRQNTLTDTTRQDADRRIGDVVSRPAVPARAPRASRAPARAVHAGVVRPRHGAARPAPAARGPLAGGRGLRGPGRDGVDGSVAAPGAVRRRRAGRQARGPRLGRHRPRRRAAQRTPATPPTSTTSSPLKLKDCCHVYGVTRRGYGASSQPTEGYDEPSLGARRLDRHRDAEAEGRRSSSATRWPAPSSPISG